MGINVSIFAEKYSYAIFTSAQSGMVKSRQTILVFVFGVSSTVEKRFDASSPIIVCS